jgi:hypothetical protein
MAAALYLFVSIDDSHQQLPFTASLFTVGLIFSSKSQIHGCFFVPADEHR